MVPDNRAINARKICCSQRHVLHRVCPSGLERVRVICAVIGTNFLSAIGANIFAVDDVLFTLRMSNCSQSIVQFSCIIQLKTRLDKHLKGIDS